MKTQFSENSEKSVSFV